MIKLDLSHALTNADLSDYQAEVSEIHKMIHEKTGKGSDFLGWVDWATHYDKAEFSRIKDAAKRIRANSNVLLVCGIGGSYLGARAAIEAINGHYSKDSVEVIYVGNTFSSSAVVSVLNYIQDKEVSLNVISKSGKTTETSLAFRIFRQFIENKYGEEEAVKRIYVTTDQEKGLLRPLVNQKGYESFIIPDSIGGRFSVITSVGLLPMAAAGIDIDEFMDGLNLATEDLNTDDLTKNKAYQYGVMRRVLEKEGKSVEMFVTYEPHLVYVAEWLKQLYGESEGKEGKGLLPASVNNSTDLHSMGQFVQEGTKLLFQTVITVKDPIADMAFPKANDNSDEMDYLVGKSLHWINEQAFKGTLEAHEKEGQVPHVLLELPDTSAKTVGYMFYFFFKVLSLSAYMLDVNPFDQPGVEVYKRNMFKLLGKE